MSPVTSIDQLTCENCIWAAEIDGNIVKCAYVSSHSNGFEYWHKDRFCRSGQWAVWSTAFETYDVMYRPAAIENLLGVERKQ